LPSSTVSTRSAVYRLRTLRLPAALGTLLLLSACASAPPQRYALQSGAPAYNQSYVVHGTRYYVLPSAQGYDKRGVASWYGPKFHGRKTSTGARYNMYAMTAASRDLPLPTWVRVTNLENGRQVVVKVNDRGPFVPNRIIDLSYAAAKQLDMIRKGTALVEVQAIDPQNPAINPPPPKDVAHGGEVPHLYLQVGAFASMSNANSFKAQLAARGLGPLVVQAGTTSGGRTLYRVRLGPLADVNALDAATEHMRALGIKGFRVTVD
jgi:rare lipoprotein A